MKVVTSLDDIDARSPSIVSIGNFDGFHLGHRAILSTVVKRAREQQCRSVAMTFAPHPIRFLAPYKAPKLITTLDQKIRLIEETGPDILFIVPFDEPFSQLSPEAFIDAYLIRGLNARAVCVGSNFNFGYRGSGSVETLRAYGGTFEVIEVEPVTVRGGVVSSTRIRELIGTGQVSRACRLLNRWPGLEGLIVPGAGRGRKVTVPTLNLAPENELWPARGVYVTQVSLDGGPLLESVTNVGIRPTFDEHETTIETFILDAPFPGNAKSLRLQFLWRLRDEVKFESPEALRRQIGQDVERSRKFFRLLKTFRHARIHTH